MNRREFLHRTGASATIAGLAGCLGSATLDGGSPGGDSASDDSADRNTTDVDFSDDCEPSENSSAEEFSGVDSDADEPFREISLGSRDGVAFPENNRPRTIRVWNAADAIRTIDVRIVRGDDRPLDEAIEFAPDAYLTATLAEPADYSVTVEVSSDAADGSCGPEAGTGAGTSESSTAEAATFPVPRSAFDCNVATIDVGVMPDGRIGTAEDATAMGCPNSRVTETTFSTEDGDCGTEHRVNVSFDPERVRVEGTVRTPTPQWGLELAAVEYDKDAGSLTLRVRATESETANPGVQCVAEVPYEASVGFESALPGEVVVVHETNDGTVEAVRKGRSNDG